MKFPRDILLKIESIFETPEKAEFVKVAFDKLHVRSDETERIIRCILTLSGADVDALISFIKQANEDYRNIIWGAEYDNRNVRKFNFSHCFDEQNEYKMGVNPATSGKYQS